MPGAHIGPAKVNLHHIDLIALLQQTLVYSHIGQGGIVTLYIADNLIDGVVLVLAHAWGEEFHKQFAQTMAQVSGITQNKTCVP